MNWWPPWVHSHSSRKQRPHPEDWFAAILRRICNVQMFPPKAPGNNCSACSGAETPRMVTPQKEWSSDQPRRHLQRAGTGAYVVRSGCPPGIDPNSYFVAGAAAADFTTKPAELRSF